MCCLHLQAVRDAAAEANAAKGEEGKTLRAAAAQLAQKTATNVSVTQGAALRDTSWIRVMLYICQVYIYDMCYFTADPSPQHLYSITNNELHYSYLHKCVAITAS
jgi:hypothetical protein